MASFRSNDRGRCSSRARAGAIVEESPFPLVRPACERTSNPSCCCELSRQTEVKNQMVPIVHGLAVAGLGTEMAPHTPGGKCGVSPDLVIRRCLVVLSGCLVRPLTRFQGPDSATPSGHLGMRRRGQPIIRSTPLTSTGSAYLAETLARTIGCTK